MWDTPTMNGQQKALDMDSGYADYVAQQQSYYSGMSNALGFWNPLLYALAGANAYRNSMQGKLDDAKEFLKSRAPYHPEWNVKR